MSEEWQLPSSWCWTTTGEISSVVGGGTPDTSDSANFGGSIPWITPADMSNHHEKTIGGGARTITVQGLSCSGAKVLPAGTVLFSSRAPIGYVAVASNEVTTNQGFKSFIPKPGVFSDYLYYWLKASKKRAESLASGTTFLELSGAKAAQLPVPLAPIAEQTRIVAKLEELLSDLDAGVAELKAAQKKLAQYRQSLLKAAVEGALTAEWRTQHQPTETGAQLLQRILQERRARWEARQRAKFAEQGKTPPKDWQKKYPEPVQPDTTDLPELPQGWVWASLDQLALDSSYGTSVKCGYESQGASVLRIPNVIARKLVLDDLKFASQPLDLHKSEYLAPGDILVVRTNGSVSLVGRAAEVTEPLPGDFYFASYLLRVRCLETSVVHRWVSALLASRQGRSWIESRAASSAGQHNLSLSTLLTIPIPLPPIVEQAEAMNALEAVLLSVSEQEQFLDKSLQQSTAQRQNILRAAFSGQLVAQDPHDEPASVLLERIRAERAAQGAVKKPRGRKAKEAA